MLCILTFVGKGYTPRFVQRMDEVVMRIGEGEPVKLVWGADSICEGWLDCPDCHCHRWWDLVWRDVMGFIATSVVLRRACWPGRTFVLTPKRLRRMRRAFAAKVSRAGCVGCPWFGLCSGVAKDGFRASRLT